MSGGFDQYWARLVNANPALTNESGKMTITVGTLKKLLKRSFHQGGSIEVDSEKMRRASKQIDDVCDGLDDIFKGLFGGM